MPNFDLRRLPPSFWAAITVYPTAYFALRKSRDWYASSLPKDSDRKTLAQNIISSFHSFSVSLIGFHVTTTSTITSNGLIFRGADAITVLWQGHNFNVVDLVLGLESGYLIYDLALEIVAALKARASPLMIAHHFFIGGGFVAWFTLVSDRRAGYWIMLFLIMNISTPFLHLRWYLRKANRGAQVVRNALDVALVGIFFMCRIAMTPYILSQWGRAARMSWWRAFFILPLRCQIPTLGLTAANIIWWSRLTSSTIRQLKYDRPSVDEKDTKSVKDMKGKDEGVIED